MSSFHSDLKKELGVPGLNIHYLVRSAPHRYKLFHIPKKRGGTRLIAQPAREVKVLQRYVIKNVLSQYPVHEAASAYIAGRSIGDNAKLHAAGRFLLKMDFSDFFYSIRDSDFFLHTQKYAPQFTEDFDAIRNVLFWRNERKLELSLCIGAPSSPAVSNTVMYDFDYLVAEHCRATGVTYSRYADDLAFSAADKGVLYEIENFVSGLLAQLEYPKLILNENKTIHASKAVRRTVTGLNITQNGTLSIGRDNKRNIRSDLHHFSLGDLPAADAERVAGYLAFILDVEPEFFARLERTFGNNLLQKLKDFAKTKDT